MSQKKLYILLSLFVFSVSFAFAQQGTVFQGTQSIVDDINKKKVGQGRVRVMQDESIDDSLALYNVNSDTSNVIRLSDEKVNGYKIQVFSGNNQNKSRAEAESKQRLIRESFPEHQALVTYESPTWRLRVGNFLTRSEAEALLGPMKEAFPSFGKEMYVVSDVIRRPLNR